MESVRYLDRRLTETSTGVSSNYDSGADKTTWTVPYEVATDGSEGDLVVVRRDGSPEVYSVTRPAVNKVAVSGKGDLTGVQVYIGVKYTFEYDPTPIFLRDRQGRVDDRGRLQLRYVDLRYHKTTDLEVTVSSTGRSDQVYTVDVDSPEEGSLRIPVAARNTYTSFVFKNDTPGGCAISRLTWEGDLTTRSRRL